VRAQLPPLPPVMLRPLPPLSDAEPRRYNDPGTLPPFRRNEVLVKLLPGYDIWTKGEVETFVVNYGST